MTKNNLYIFLLIISLLGGTAAQAEKVALTADRQRPMDLLRPVSFNQRRDFQAEVMLERRVADTYSEAAGPLVQDVILCESTGMWRGFPQLVKDTLRDIPIRERLVLMVLVGNGLADTREHIEGAGHLVRLSLMQKQFAALPDFLQAKFLSLGAQIERALADRYMPAPKREADVIQALEHLTRSAVFYRRSAKAARSFVAQLDTYRGAPGVPDMRDKAELRALSLRENALNATAALTHYMNGHLDILVREFRLSISAGAGRSVDRAFTACARGHALLVKEWGERGCMDLADQRQLTTHLFVEIDMCADMLKRIFEVEHEWVGGIEDLAEQVGVLRKKAIDYRASVLADIRTKKNSPASGRATEDAIVRMNPQAAWTIAQMMRECVQKDQIKNFAGSLCLAVEKLQALDGYPLAEIEKCVLIRYAARKLARRAIVSCDQRAAGEASGEEVSVDTADEAIWDGLPIIQDPVKALSVALEALEAKPALLGKRDPDGFRILSLIMEASTLQGLSRAMTLEEDDPLHRQKTELTIDQYRAVDRHLGRVILLCDEAKDLIRRVRDRAGLSAPLWLDENGEQIAIMELEASGDSLEDMARLAPALQWDHAAELVERAGHCVERIADTEGSMRSSDRPLSPDFLPMAAETARRGAIALNKIHGSMPPHGIGRARVSLLTLADRLTALREGLFMPASDRRPPDDI